MKEIQKIEVTLSGSQYDGYHAYSNIWEAATDENGVITLHSKFVANFKTGNTFEVAVVYTTNSGETRTATLDVKRQ